MRLIRYRDARGQIGYAAEQPGGGLREISGDIYGDFTVTSRQAAVQQRLAPISPRIFFCVGLNYRQHALETKAKFPEYPILFMKSPAAVQHPGEPIYLPTFLASAEVDYECELAVVIGKTCRNVTRDRALDYVLGYTCANDVSARDWQRQKGGGQWCRGKTFDTFAPLGPCLVTPDEIQNPAGLSIRTLLNGVVMQDGNTSDMIFDVPALIAFLSGSTTLLPGTVILTGTPSGVGMARNPPVWLKAGDDVVVEIEKIGVLQNPVRTEPADLVISSSFHP